MKIILRAGSTGHIKVLGDVSEYPAPGEPVIMRDARTVTKSGAFDAIEEIAANGPDDKTILSRPIPVVCWRTWVSWFRISKDVEAAFDEIHGGES